MTRSFAVASAVCLLLAGASVFARHADEVRGADPRRISDTDKSADDPDDVYRRREDLASAARAAALWGAAAADDYEAAWKIARAHGWLGTHAPESERRAALERGVSAGEAAIGLQPARPEGHFWLAANMGVLAQSFGLSQGLKYRSRIKSELERAIAIDPSWSEASAETALGQWYVKVPRLFGGSRAKAEQHFRHVLDRFPQSKNALSFLADILIAQGRTPEGRALLQRLIDTPIEPAWAPEDRDLKRTAAERLRTLGAGDRQP
jgi:tetratricopeptide (TPR) repeat protein